MNILEKTAFTWVLAWVLMDSFVPEASRQDKLHTCIIVSASIAYLYGLHMLIFSKLRLWFRK